MRAGALGGSPVPLSTVAGLRRAIPQLRLDDADGYGSPAPGATAGPPTAEGYFPLKFEEPR